jgi:hypothetical protein
MLILVSLDRAAPALTAKAKTRGDADAAEAKTRGDAALNLAIGNDILNRVHIQ